MRGRSALKTVHWIEVGDGSQPAPAGTASLYESPKAIGVTLGGKKFLFSTEHPYAVTGPD